jgi:histidine kinase
LKVLTDFKLDGYIFFGVDQLVHGKDHIEDENEKVELETLCLRAGERAVLPSDFKTALRYLELGETLLEVKRRWIDHYHLTLNICNTQVEACCCIGDFGGLEKAAGSILVNARSFNDKLRGYMLRTYPPGTLVRLQDAIQLGLQVLERLGETFLKKPGLPNIVANFLDVKHMLRLKADSTILRLRDMCDPQKLAAMG